MSWWKYTNEKFREDIIHKTIQSLPHLRRKKDLWTIEQNQTYRLTLTVYFANQVACILQSHNGDKSKIILTNYGNNTFSNEYTFMKSPQEYSTIDCIADWELWQREFKDAITFSDRSHVNLPEMY